MDHIQFYNKLFALCGAINLNPDDAVDSSKFDWWSHDPEDMSKKINMTGGMSSDERIGIWIDENGNWFEINYCRGFLSIYGCSYEFENNNPNEIRPETFGEFKSVIRDLIADSAL